MSSKERYQVVIIDDEKTGIQNLEEALKDIGKLEISGTTQRPNEGRELIMECKPDLLFLDVEMPGMSGLELIRDMKDMINWKMQVVFYTAYNKYLLEALRESAFDYLLKPFEISELMVVVNRFLDYMQSEHSSTFKEHADALYAQNNDHFLITTIKGFRKIKLSDVGYFDYDTLKRLWSIVTKEERIKLKRGVVAQDILKLSPAFVQINQSQIININHLSSIEDHHCVLFAPFDKQNPLSLSRKFADEVEKKFIVL
jgi:two-component system LytT family response regulator